MEELNAHFFGDVHGVGFRATTIRIAKELQLHGFVRNCSDGSVEIVAQGSKGKLQKLIEKLQEIFGDKYITKVSIEYRKPTKIHSDFQIFRD